LSGGTQVVFGSATSTTIDSGGGQSIVAGGTADGTTVSSGGTQYDAGTANNTKLAGGTQEVFSGGTVNGATISSGGLLELQSGATAGSSTITFSGGGTLRLDGTGAYGFLVAGFAIPDAFDLSAINFASATKQYSGNTSSGTLTVGDGTHSASILLLGNYTLASFNLGAETGGASGTLVTDPQVASGSAITPPHG
jgi:trimeric autotransporter adhesin